VDVEGLLARRLAVGQEEIDPLAPEAAAVYRGGDLLRGPKQAGAGLFGQIGERSGVLVGHDEDVARVDGLDVHEGGATGVATLAGRLPASIPQNTQSSMLAIMAPLAAGRPKPPPTGCGRVGRDRPDSGPGPCGCYFRVCMLLFDRSKGL